MNLGAFYIFVSTIFFTLMGFFVKYLSGIPSHEVVFFRSFIIFWICIVTLKIKEKKKGVKINLLGNNRKMLTLRGLTGASGLAIYFFTIQKLPFAIAITLQYLSPIFTVLVSSFWLKEKGSKLQWVSLFISFFAVALIQNVTSLNLGFYAYLGVLGALLSALSYTNVRQLSKTEDSLVIVFYFALVTLIIGGPYTLYNFVTPTTKELIILIMMGGCGHIGQYFLTRGYESDKASSVANFAYFNVVWSILISEFILGEKLSMANLVGIALIVFSAILSKIKFKR